MAELTPGYVKALFHQLVQRVGKTEAAAAYLEVSGPRITQLQSPNYPDMPTVMQVATLEAVAGQSVVFGALAALPQDAATSHKDPMEEACELTEAATNLLHKVRTKAPEREIQAAILDVQREAQDVSRALRAV